MISLRDRPNYRVPWSDADMAQLAQAIRRGDTVPQIAQAMGRSQEAVRNRATAAGLMKKRVIGSRSRLFKDAAAGHASSN